MELPFTDGQNQNFRFGGTKLKKEGGGVKFLWGPVGACGGSCGFGPDSTRMTLLHFEE